MNSASTTVSLGRSPFSPAWRYWIAPVVWMCVIFLFSTDLFSSSKTAWALIHIMRALHINLAYFPFLHHVTRKAAHFGTYFVLSLLLFRAWRATLPQRYQKVTRQAISQEGRTILDAVAPAVKLTSYVARVWIEPLWTLRWSVLAVVLSAVTASMDEFHQSFLPSRTGTVRDVVLDTMGAYFAQVVLMLILLDRLRRVRE